MATKNFAIATVLHPYDAAATEVVLVGGHSARFGTPPFPAVWYNATDYGRPSDDPGVEVVTVTAIDGDTLTITRGQEGTLASAKNTAGKSYRIYQTLTAAMWDDLLAAQRGYRHIQNIPASEWTVPHGLGKRSIPAVYDSAGEVIWGAIKFLDDNNLTITFGAQFSGEAHVP